LRFAKNTTFLKLLFFFFNINTYDIEEKVKLIKFLSTTKKKKKTKKTNKNKPAIFHFPGKIA